MIEPLRYNVEAHLPYEIPRLAYCNSCLLDKNGKDRPNIAVRYCSLCPTSLGVHKNPGALQCKMCDEKIHKNSEFKDHVRQIVVVGPGLRKKIIVRGDGYNYPHTLDKINIKMKAKVYHRGRRVGRIPITNLDYTCGMSGRCLHIQVLGAKDLRVNDFLGSSDPYVVYSFCGKPLHATRVQPRTTNPVWHNETFVVPLNEYLTYPKDMPHIQKDVIRLEVFDKDYITKSNFLGHIELTRSKLEKMALLADQQAIRIPLTMREFHGILHFQLGFDTEYLYIQIVMADDLYKVDPSDLPNPFGKLYLSQSSFIGTTDIMKRTINPRWMKGNLFKIPILHVLFAERYIQSQIEAFQATERRSKKVQQLDELMEDFAVLPTRFALFRVELFDKKRFQDDESMGNAFVSISKLRKMLPTFPSTDVTTLIEYSTFVTKLVQQERAIIDEKSRRSITKYLASCFKSTSPSNTETDMNIKSLEVNINQEQSSSKIETIAGKRRGNVFGVHRDAPKLVKIDSSASYKSFGDTGVSKSSFDLEIINDSRDEEQDDDDDDDDDEAMMLKGSAVKPTNPYGTIKYVDDNDNNNDILVAMESQSNIIAESVETDSTESSVSLHGHDELLSLQGDKHNELPLESMHMIGSNKDNVTTSILNGSDTTITTNIDVDKFTHSTSAPVLERPETTSTITDPTFARTFRPPPPSSSLSTAVATTNILDFNRCNDIMSTKNDIELVSKVVIINDVIHEDSDDSEESKGNDDDLEENKSDDEMIIGGTVDVEIGHRDNVDNQMNDDDDDIDAADNDDNDDDDDDNDNADDYNNNDNGDVDHSDIDDELEEVEKDLENNMDDDVQNEDVESANHDDDVDHDDDDDDDDDEVDGTNIEINQTLLKVENSVVKDDNVDINSNDKNVTTNVSSLITNILSTKLFAKKDKIQWSDVYPVPVMMKQDSIERAAQGFLVLRLIISNRGTVLLGVSYLL